ncbi:MAG: HD domain-containing protein, partial [Flavobacteriales bacterium]
NVASRMESSSEVNKVNISGETHELIAPYFECTYRGKVLAKNKGHIDMYFVNRIKPELSEDGEGKKPNKDFWSYVNLHFYSKINYRKAERYLLNLLEENLPDNLYYHDISHTKDVVRAVERLAFMEGVEGEDLFLLQTAALYHDAGFVEQYDNNEDIGVRMAKEILPQYGYTPDQIETVARLIKVTEVPHDPQDHLEEIICDADLDYLGREDFHEIADQLKTELMERGKIQSDRQWDEMQVKFLKMHKYFTKSAKNLRLEGKKKHLKEIEERLKVRN